MVEDFFRKNLEKFFVAELTKVVNEKMENFEQIDMIFPYMEAYTNHYIVRMIKLIGPAPKKIGSATIDGWIKKIIKIMKRIYLKAICSNIFEFIKQMADEQQIHRVVKTLREVKKMSIPTDIEEICVHLKEKILERLLSEDLITDTILSYYFHIVKVLNIVDKEMIYYKNIITPVRVYLVKRPDVLKAIIAFWKDFLASPEESVEEYRVLDAANYNYQGLVSDDDEEEADKWDVQNVGVLDRDSKTTVKYKVIDKLSLLFDLFGSDFEFIEEYENLLAEKLLLSKPINIDEEFKNIELLKLRFGESKMNRSTVILRDVEDSRKFNQRFREEFSKTKKFSEENGLSPINSNILIVSSGFWPINSGVSHFKYPKKYQKIFEEIHEQFKKLRHIMHLEHLNNLGKVTLDLTFKNGVSDTFRCEPIHAILIGQFDKNENPSQGPISLETLAQKLEAHQNFIRSKLFFWVKKGVLVECNRRAGFPGVSGGLGNSQSQIRSMSLARTTSNLARTETMVEEGTSYELVDNYVPGNDSDENILVEEDEHELISRENINSREMIQNLKLFEPKILLILSLSGPKTLQKLKCLLETVYKPNPTGPAFIQMNELSDVLNALVKSRKLILQNEVYSLCVHA